ncbi:DNA-damage-inducible protein D (plasmid) [Zymomonas mobilis subsp. mobilis]|uniref:DNA damage-inducible protein D n=1 Tax=Zymomonas mobilis TaxID=542 RepID=UPI000D200A76|nr:DNA damage-inducible protein D [Zymomonas mobilis]AVZ28803.1 DNA-damage-inducible protein D [Zymomonas mobilis subsp. mobilis]
MTDNRNLDHLVKYDCNFDEAMQRIAQTNPNEVIKLVETADDVNSIDSLIDKFEDAGHDDGDNDKRWLARDLQSLLGYTKWDKFEQVIERSMTACANAGHLVNNHFQKVFPQTGKNPKGGRPARDFQLDRYACYLIAQNASSSMKQVAFAQTYFAIQTRRQELADHEGVNFDQLSENQKRLYLRNQVVAENKRLMSAAKASGVKLGPDFGKFNNKGYQGLYGDRGKQEIQEYKGLSSKANILDHMGSTELAANLFRITQTEEKLRSKNIVGKENACNAHYEVGLKVRQTMQELSGILPEDLPVAEDVKKIARQERKQQRMRTVEPQNRIEQPLAAPEKRQPVEIDLTKDLWKYALLAMSVQPNGEITTHALISALPEYIALSDEHLATNESRKDSKFSQIVRNLKSHKTSKSNFIYQGYAKATKGGFKITRRGIEFVLSYFAE